MLTHDIFLKLKKGEMTREDAIKEIGKHAKRAEQEEDVFGSDCFEHYNNGDTHGEEKALARLLFGAVTNLQERVQQ